MSLSTELWQAIFNCLPNNEKLLLSFRTISKALKTAMDDSSLLLRSALTESGQDNLPALSCADVFEQQASELAYLQNNNTNRDIQASIDNLKNLSTKKTAFNLLYRHKLLNETNQSIIASGVPLNNGLLDCSKASLTRIPFKFFNGLTEQIKKINISGNFIKHLPESIGKCTQLKYLMADDNQLDTLPNSIAHLDKLVWLYAARNKLSKLPDNLHSFKKLGTLHLQGNNITSLPDSIVKLTKLTSLRLDDNLITTLPTAFEHLAGSLPDLRLNCLDAVPAHFPANTFYDSDNCDYLSNEALLSKQKRLNNTSK